MDFYDLMSYVADYNNIKFYSDHLSADNIQAIFDKMNDKARKEFFKALADELNKLQDIKKIIGR